MFFFLKKQNKTNTKILGDPVPKKVVQDVEKLAKAEEKAQGGSALPVLFDVDRVAPPTLD